MTVRLVELEVIIHVCRVFCSSFAACGHFVRIVFLDPALLVPPKGIPGQIRVLVVEIPLGLVCLFRVRCL